MRHSQAAASDYRTGDDARWLTATGRQMANAAGVALRSRGIDDAPAFDIIVCSPLARAVQTAEIVARHLDWADEIRCFESLRSEASPRRAVEDLQELGVSVLAVCHEPIVSSMSAILSSQASRPLAGFRPAEIHCLEDGAVSWRFQA